MSEDKRWPEWVYQTGDEPDPRFTFANERTFLAWLRTALALVAGGVALDAVDLSMADDLQHSLAIVLLVLGIGCAGTSWLRWARAERAMRQGTPLPSSPFAPLLAFVLVVCVVVLLVGLR